jgi:tRNA (mo5U34)-methyltransferase
MFFKRKQRNGAKTVEESREAPPGTSTVDPKGMTVRDWLQERIQGEPYWFLKMELPGGLITPGWSDPRLDKLPHYGLPADMTGMRVLDIGHAEGFFSFEAERRGAAEVVGIENYPPMARKFEICRAALGSRARSYLTSVYDLHPKAFGTFDLVMFFGVLYHLRHPLLALEKIHSVCTGTLLMQTATCDNQSEKPIAEFHPFGITSGPPENPSTDPTCFWFPNVAACAAMLEHVGFKDVQRISPKAPVGGVFRAKAARQEKALSPVEETAPWS